LLLSPLRGQALPTLKTLNGEEFSRAAMVLSSKQPIFELLSTSEHLYLCKYSNFVLAKLVLCQYKQDTPRDVGQRLPFTVEIEPP